ncbi:MAG TPA: hypothetical protein VFF27_10900 [Bacteroidia bacterium]|jgi:hypothetical protein|nr:hypothetical protein [Bacteroidia bacterium]
MSTEASNLIQLIKKLKPAEKRFITLELSRYKKETDLLKIFHIISNSPSITDSEIQKKLKDRKKIAQLSINKHKLYTTILELLQVFHSKNSPNNLVNSMIQQASILEKKLLSKAEEELLSKAEKIADRYELRELQLTIVQLQQKSKRNDSIHLVRRAEEICRDLMTERQLAQLLNRSIRFEREPGNRLKENENATLEKLMQESLHFKNESFTAAYYRQRICFTYFAVTGDRSQTLKFAQALLKLFHKHSYMLELESWRIEYIESLGNFIPSFIHYKKKQQLDLIYKEIDRLEVPELYKISISINVLDAYIQTGTFAESEKKVNDIQKNIASYRENMAGHNRPILYFNLAILNFGMQKFSKSLFWLNEIINNTEKNKTTISIESITRLLRLLVFYELGQTDTIENHLRSTNRYITKYAGSFVFDQIVLKCVRKISSANSPQELKTIFDESRTALLKIAKDPVESRTLDYFDFISWMDSKIKKKSFAEIVQQKNQ